MNQNIYDDNAFYESYAQLRNNPLSYNEMIEMPVMKELLPDIRDKDVLDFGCGMGKFINYMLTLNPCSITGIDLSHNMINYAKNDIQNNKVNLVVTDLLDFETNRQFHVIVSSLAIHYIEDYQSAVEKLYSLLRKDGTLLFSTEHPITTATNQEELWSHEPTPYHHFKVDHYFEETKRSTFWNNRDVEKYHRTIGTLINTLIDAGFTIERVIDTGNTEASLKMWTEETINKVIHRPPFIVIRARK